MQRYFDVVQDQNGTCIPNALVYVYEGTGGGLATLYADNGVTTTPNPVTTNSDGEYGFYAANGTYSITITATGYSSDARSGIVLFDPTDPVVIQTSSSSPALRVTQTGSGYSLLVEDSANPDATPFIVDQAGNVGINAVPSATYSLDTRKSTNSFWGIRASNPNTGASAAAAIQLGNDTNAAATAIFINSSTNTALGGVNSLNIVNGLSASLVFATAGAERGRFTADGDFIFNANAIAPTLTTNSTVSFELTSNTSLKIVVRGTDGVTRSASLVLS
jgi:hypothetical protein